MVAGPLLFSLMSSWAHYTFVPALAGVLAAEAFAIRSVLFHAANGAVCALIGWSLTRDLREEQQFLSQPDGARRRRHCRGLRLLADRRLDGRVLEAAGRPPARCCREP